MFNTSWSSNFTVEFTGEYDSGTVVVMMSSWSEVDISNTHCKIPLNCHPVLPIAAS